MEPLYFLLKAQAQTAALPPRVQADVTRLCNAALNQGGGGGGGASGSAQGGATSSSLAGPFAASPALGPAAGTPAPAPFDLGGAAMAPPDEPSPKRWLLLLLTRHGWGEAKQGGAFGHVLQPASVREMLAALAGKLNVDEGGGEGDVFQSFYEVLGVEGDAHADAIRAAYRSKAIVMHPDKGGDPADFARLALAYDTLKDDGLRANYDKSVVSGAAQRMGTIEGDEIFRAYVSLKAYSGASFQVLRSLPRIEAAHSIKPGTLRFRNGEECGGAGCAELYNLGSFFGASSAPRRVYLCKEHSRVHECSGECDVGGRICTVLARYAAERWRVDERGSWAQHTSKSNESRPYCASVWEKPAGFPWPEPAPDAPEHSCLSSKCGSFQSVAAVDGLFICRESGTSHCCSMWQCNYFARSGMRQCAVSGKSYCMGEPDSSDTGLQLDLGEMNVKDRKQMAENYTATDGAITTSAVIAGAGDGLLMDKGAATDAPAAQKTKEGNALQMQRSLADAALTRAAPSLGRVDSDGSDDGSTSPSTSPGGASPEIKATGVLRAMHQKRPPAASRCSGRGDETREDAHEDLYNEVGMEGAADPLEHYSQSEAYTGAVQEIDDADNEDLAETNDAQRSAARNLLSIEDGRGGRLALTGGGGGGGPDSSGLGGGGSGGGGRNLGGQAARAAGIKVEKLGGAKQKPKQKQAKAKAKAKKKSSAGAKGKGASDSSRQGQKRRRE